MDVSLPALRQLTTRLGDRRRGPRVGGAERREGRGPEAVEADARQAAGLDFDALAQMGGWVDDAAPDGMPNAPAELLYALIERMGGMASSRWKGMYVNLVV